MSALTKTCGYARCPRASDILVLRIMAFPPPRSAAYQPKGGTYDFWEPLDTLLGVRAASQFIRGESEVSLLKENLEFEEATIYYSPPFGCKQPSLSWQLSSDEVNCLDKAWRESKEKESVISFLNRP